MLNDRCEDFEGLTAEQAMEDTLKAACLRNIHCQGDISTIPLPEDVEFLSRAYLSDVLSFISSCTQDMLFCCSAVFSASTNRFSSSDSSRIISRDQVSYTIGSTLGYADSVYELDDQDRSRFLSYVVEHIASDLASRGFIVSVTPSERAHSMSHRVFISWGIDKEAAGYAFHITDYSQIDAIKCGVPASDVFA